MSKQTPFEVFLREHDDAAWGKIIANLLPEIHPVDQRAVQIWFSFYPVTLNRALKSAPDMKAMAKELLLQGNYLLEDRVDTSHEFLYSHRYWSEIKEAVITDAKNPPRTTLENHIRQTSKTLKIENSLVLGMTAVAYMTLQQVGWDLFNHPAKTKKKLSNKSPEQVLRERSKKDSKGFLGFLRTIDQRFTVCFNENDPEANYQIINLQTLTMGGTQDKRDYKSKDPRCIEGPIPYECQTGACGTCWVGILGGNENVSEISPFEIKRLKKIGYPYNGESRPPIRLACKTVATGSVSVVIPPWNGVCAPLYQEQPKTAETETEPEKAQAQAGQ